MRSSATALVSSLSHVAVTASTEALAAAALVVIGVLLLALRRDRRLRRSAEAASDRLARSEREFRLISDAVPAGIYRSDADGTVRYVNRRLEDIAGKPFSAMHGRPFDIVDADFALVAKAWSRARNDRTTFRCRYRATHPDGSLRWLDVEARPVCDGDVLTGWLGSVWDATDEVTSTATLRRLSQIVEATPDLIAMVDTRGQLIYGNAATRERFQVDDATAPNLAAADVYAPHHLERLFGEAVPTASREGLWAGEIDLQLPDGSIVPVSQVLVAHSRDDGSIEYYSSITRDLTDRRLIEHQLNQAVWYDAITGLPNRAHFVQRVGESLEAAEHGRLAVLRVNLDHFTLVNDSLGHETGNLVLRAFGNRLREVVGGSTLIARFGSDEFAVLATGLRDARQAVDLAERIAASLSTAIDVDTILDAVYVTASTGIAMSRHGDRATNAESLMRDSDIAVHRAKENGRARIELFAEDLRHHAHTRLRTATDLHRALTAGEFRVVYQPEVDLRTGHLTGVEALVRWHHPERGLVPPNDFIPLAEQTGLILGIGSWVLDTAIATAAEWIHTAPADSDFTVWVNLSARQLADPAMVAIVAASLTRHDFVPSALGLEITESALLDDADRAIAALIALRELGVQLAVDDFGTGYSSLAYLKRLPVDAVKIDRSFVNGLANDPDDAAIVGAVVGMARALRLTTIAEGVETAEQLAALRAVGGDVAQGYYFATPQPAAHITRLLESDATAAVFAASARPRTAPTVLGGLPTPRTINNGKSIAG